MGIRGRGGHVSGKETAQTRAHFSSSLSSGRSPEGGPFSGQVLAARACQRQASKARPPQPANTQLGNTCQCSLSCVATLGQELHAPNA